MNESREIWEAFVQDRKDTNQIRDEMNRHIFEVRVKNIYERRDFLKHITLISAAILGFLPVIVGQPINKAYLIIGAILHTLVIAMVLSYLREHLDSDSLGLQKSQDKYDDILGKKLELIDKYLAKQNLSPGDISQYYTELRGSKSAEDLQVEHEDLQTQRKNREQQLLDYFSELVIFLFVTGLFFVLISAVNLNVSNDGIIFIVIILFTFSFSNFTDKVINLIARLARIL